MERALRWAGDFLSECRSADALNWLRLGLMAQADPGRRVLPARGRLPNPFGISLRSAGRRRRERAAACSVGDERNDSPARLHRRAMGAQLHPARMVAGIGGAAASAAARNRPPLVPSAVSIVRAPAYDQNSLRHRAAHARRTQTGRARAHVVLKPNLVEFEPESVHQHPSPAGPRRMEAFRALGAASVRIAEGPGHRRNTLDLADAAGYFKIVPHFEDLFVDLNVDEVSRVRPRAPVFAAGKALSAEYRAGGRPAGLHAQDEDPSLGGRHALHEEPVRRSCPAASTAGPRTCCTGPASTSASPICTPPSRGSFAIVDGIVGMEGNGPIQGAPEAVGVLVAGRDPVAVDATCCRIMRIDPYYDRDISGWLPGNVKVADIGSEIRQIGEEIRAVATPFALIPEFQVDQADINPCDPNKFARNPARGRTRPAPRSPPPARLASGRAAYVWVSLLLAIPCFWQPRVEAGDLSSHIYNSWLAQLIESGRRAGPGRRQPDHQRSIRSAHGRAIPSLGAEAAQRISVSLAVLVFVWGAFAFVRAVAGRPCWYLMPRSPCWLTAGSSTWGSSIFISAWGCVSGPWRWPGI